MPNSSRFEEARRWGSSALLRQREALAAASVAVDHVRIRGSLLRVGHRNGAGPPLLICNGIGANFELLLPFVAALRGRRILLFDVPGTGGSEDACILPLIRNYAYYARRVLDHFGAACAHVAGISWGGLLAQRLAYDAPKQIRSLVLMATSPGILMLPGRLEALRLMATPQRYFSRDFMVRHAHTLYGGELLREPQKAVAHARMARAPSLRSYVQQLMAAQFFTSLPWLRRVRCPALVLAGDDDPLMRVANSRLLASCLPKAQFEIISGGGHLLAIMQSERTAQLVERFLDVWSCHQRHEGCRD